ncbi:glycosyltransferase family 39 protein [Zavarzinella formosa]|uniref:glycosyltransferase family 39 protein n=1 Tax=Zavarzinella formosa TaxID=360055 RepID=UPI0002E89C98|nr:glycosyltransferase family 39 protein [Zavarzinella formosa]
MDHSPAPTVPDRFQIPDRFVSWLTIGVLILGTAGHLAAYFSRPSFWYDEAYLLLNIREKSYVELLGPTLNQQAAPPLFMWSLRLMYDLFGMSELAMRFPPMLAGLLALFVAVPLGRTALPSSGRLWPVWFAALSFHGITLSNDVKPYSLDLLMTELVLLAGLSRLKPPGPDHPRYAEAGLLLLAVLAPWLSYPSVFSLGGVGLAWAWVCVRHRDRRTIIGFLSYVLMGLASGIVLYLTVIRFQRTATLTDYWAFGFIDCRSGWDAMRSLLSLVRQAGDYHTTGMGIPFLVLAPLGWLVLRRRSPAAALALTGAVLLMLAANLMKAYPMQGRLVMFAAPIMWLSVGAALGETLDRIGGRWRQILFAVFLFLPVSDVSRTVLLVKNGGGTMTDFRGACDYLRKHRQPEDTVWMPMPEPYNIYNGSPDGLVSSRLSIDGVIAAAAGHRIWLVTPPDGPMRSFATIAEFETSLTAAGYRKTDEQPFFGILALTYERPSRD